MIIFFIKYFSRKALLNLVLVLNFFFLTASAQLNNQSEALRVITDNGTIQGINDSGIKVFKGVPFARPPIGNLRWKAPQPVKKWSHVLKANHFAPRCMQRNVFSDMNFRSDGISEDCLYLNVWTPTLTGNKDLSVLVYFYGGGFIAGDGSEYRYDGESMARNKEILVITVNYRLGVFGFLSHPALTEESPHRASGNYGLLDQAMAMSWVKRNVEVFGGDPDKITIAGESAGSISVSALMASPLSRNLFRGAIGESGSILGPLSSVSLSEGEEMGKQFEKIIGVESLKELRIISADSLLTVMAQQSGLRFPITIDGYFFPKSPTAIYANGEQSHVPLLVGWNSGESTYRNILKDKEPTPENYVNAINDLYEKDANKILEFYPGNSKNQVIKSATDLASDRFIALGTWKWSYMQSKFNDSPVYRYYYSQPRPAQKATKDTSRAAFAVHSAEIEYVMGNLPTNNVYDWTSEDYKVSHIMQSYFANFIKTGNPNGLGLPAWSPIGEGNQSYFMDIAPKTRLKSEKHRKRYLFLDKLVEKDR